MFESTPKWRKVFGQRSINTDLGPGARSVEVTAGAYQQTEFTSQDGQCPDLLGRLQTVDHLYGMAASLQELGDQFTTFTAGEIVVRGVRKADPGSRGAQHRDGIFQRRPVQFDVTE